MSTFDPAVDDVTPDRLARLAVPLAYVAIGLLLAVIVFLAAGARSDAQEASARADRASRASCELVGVVRDLSRVNNEGVAVLITPPGPLRDAAIEALRADVAAQTKAAANAERVVPRGC